VRASDLIGREVRCRDAVVGTVVDLRLQTGVAAGDETHELRLDGLVVSTAHWGGTLGYDRRDAGRPWLVWRVVRWLHRKDRYVRWDLVRRDRADGVVRVDASLADLPGVPVLPS
jgi:hypothetical protein